MKRLSILVLFLCLYACSSIKTEVNYIKTELFFGLSEKGVVITEAQWNTFRKNIIDKAFPNGYTEVSCSGHWTGADGIPVSENCKMIIYLNKNTKSDQEAVRKVVTSYKKQFNQESVLVVKNKVEAHF